MGWRSHFSSKGYCCHDFQLSLTLLSGWLTSCLVFKLKWELSLQDSFFFFSDAVSYQYSSTSCTIITITHLHRCWCIFDIYIYTIIHTYFILVKDNITPSLDKAAWSISLHTMTIYPYLKRSLSGYLRNQITLDSRLSAWLLLHHLSGQCRLYLHTAQWLKTGACQPRASHDEYSSALKHTPAESSTTDCINDSHWWHTWWSNPNSRYFSTFYWWGRCRVYT